MKILFKLSSIHKTTYYLDECSLNFDSARALYHYKKYPSMATLKLLGREDKTVINVQDPVTKLQYKFLNTTNWSLIAEDISKYGNFEKLVKTLKSFAAIEEFTFEKLHSLSANTATDNGEALFQIEYARSLLTKAQGKLDNDQLIRAWLGCLITQRDRPLRPDASFWSYRPVAFFFPSHQTMFIEAIKPVIEFFKEVIGVQDENELKLAFDKFRRGDKVLVTAEPAVEKKVPAKEMETELTRFKSSVHRVR